MNTSRNVERLVLGQATSDGAGVRLTRVLTSDLQRRLDPFLMLDNFRSDDPDDYIAGFPEHPHRGFETVTYMLAGRMRHRDSVGNEGVLEPGGAQWMTAARGILHAEMPEQEDGLMEGFQLWLNLPAAKKMAPAGYRDIPAADIPSYQAAPGLTVRVLAGRAGTVEGAVARPDTEPVFVDLRFSDEAGIDLDLPAGHNAFVCVYRGSLLVGEPGTGVDAHRMAILETRPDADGVRVRSSGPAAAIVVAGRPLHEPIAQYGPFVMNTREELMQAVRDLQTGRFL